MKLTSEETFKMKIGITFENFVFTYKIVLVLNNLRANFDNFTLKKKKFVKNDF